VDTVYPPNAYTFKLDQRIAASRRHGEKARLVVGNSELGIEAKFKYSKFSVLVSAAEIPELTAVSESADGLLIGASVTISALENLCKEHVVYAAYCPP
jgi:xanthine dehydrogenase/oxidase